MVDNGEHNQDMLAEWLTAEMKKRNLGHRKLGEKAGIAHSSITRALDPSDTVSFEVCVKLAYALGTNPVTVLEMAGLLPRSHPNQAIERDLIFLFQQLRPEQKDQVIRYIRFLLDEKRPG